jgi:glycosyltransferase involved in cell wall biosynthesis
VALTPTSAARGTTSVTPRISVVIPTYNRVDYLAQAIDSVLQQTLHDYEVIVVDDGSTDDTPDLVASYGDRVRYVPTKNGGCAHARNVGMAVARGEQLAFLDSDDLLYPYMLEIEARLLDRYPDVGMVYAEMSGFDDAGFFDRYHLKTYHESAYRDPRHGYDQIFSSSVRLGDLGVLPDALVHEAPELLERRAYFGHIFDWYLTNIGVFQNNMLVRREVVTQVGPRNERTRFYEERDYILRISRANRVCFLDVPTYKLRYHPGQLSGTSGANGRYVWARKQQELLRVFKHHAFADAAYYAQHRTRLDEHLAQLHRAVAVPLMLCEGEEARRRNYAGRARKYLARCWRYGHPQRTLWLATFAPGAIRRAAVSLLELARQMRRRLVRPWHPAAEGRTA